MIIMINIKKINKYIYIYIYIYYTHTYIYTYGSNTNTKPVRLGGVLNYSIFNFVLFAFSKSTL
jgi:hypothetical protein